jgi:hypothetical protein
MSPQVKRGELHQRRGGRQRRKCYQNPFVLVSECSVAGAARRELSAKLLHLVVGVHTIARHAGTTGQWGRAAGVNLPARPISRLAS